LEGAPRFLFWPRPMPLAERGIEHPASSKEADKAIKC